MHTCYVDQSRYLGGVTIGKYSHLGFVGHCYDLGAMIVREYQMWGTLLHNTEAEVSTAPGSKLATVRLKNVSSVS